MLAPELTKKIDLNYSLYKGFYMLMNSSMVAIDIQ